MDPIIKLEKVDFYYDKGKPSEVHSLKNINLEIQEGEYVSFFGPSGCGKSSMLYVISGVEKPTSGRVIVKGQDLMKFSEKELSVYRQVGIGIIFQSFNLIPSIKVIDNIVLPMSFLGISIDTRKRRAMEILERLGIADLADRYPHELSGGQQQRVGIARALSNNPPIILADEPIGNLDSQNAENVLDLLREFNQEDGKTIIMVTHEAWSLRDVEKIFYMKDGAIIKSDTQKPAVAQKIPTDVHYKKLHPELPRIEVLAKSMAALILRGYSEPEVKRLEYFLAHRLSNKIDKDVFKMVLDRPYNEGGVGLWKQKAKKIADYVEEIIEEEKELKDIYKKIEKNPEAPLYEEVSEIRRWLFEDFKVQLAPIQIERLNEIIKERLQNVITPQNFQKVLDLGKAKGGVGLRTRTSLQIAEKLENILGGSGSNITLPA